MKFSILHYSVGFNNAGTVANCFTSPAQPLSAARNEGVRLHITRVLLKKQEHAAGQKQTSSEKKSD